ncbi:hypothetical protein HJC23_005747 [Cyclotella cryptica]|uniref:Uncharacterized protein n=1 Tax=Cyclotella cryptica TaxID=29204 RepID=A0ABD3QFA3_9STRA
MKFGLGFEKHSDDVTGKEINHYLHLKSSTQGRIHLRSSTPRGSHLSLLLSKKLSLKSCSCRSCCGSLCGLLSLKNALGTRLFLGLQNSHHIVKGDLRSNHSLGILGKHDGDLDTNDTLPHENVSHGSIGVNLSGVTCLDHVPVTELHGLGTLSSQLTGDNNLATLGGGLHDETDDSVASTTDGKSGEELEFERFGLSLSTEPTVLDALSVKFHGALGEIEPLLDDRGQFADALTLVSEDVLGLGGANDNFGAVGGGTDFDSGVAVFGEFAGEELVEFGVEDSVGDKLAFDGHFGTVGHGHVGSCGIFVKKGTNYCLASIAAIGHHGPHLAALKMLGWGALCSSVRGVRALSGSNGDGKVPCGSTRK